MRKIAFGILIVLLVSACKKAGINYVRGTVVEEGTGIPIAGTKLFLSESAYFNGRLTIIDSAITDENGNYKIKYNRIPSTSYFISCINFNYTLSKGLQNNLKLEHGKSLHNFTMIPHAFLKMHYIKKAVSDTSVMVIFNSTGFQDAIEGPMVSYSLAVQPFDVTRQYEILANRWLRIDWRRYSISTFTGGVNAYDYPNRETFFVKKNDTLNYTITFN